MSDSAIKFISTYFQKILDESGREKKFETLKSKCQLALQTLKDLNPGKSALQPYVSIINIKSLSDSKVTDEKKKVKLQWHTLSNLLFDPLQLACETNQAHFIEPALDCLQKLFGYGYIQNITPDLSSQEKKRKLMSRVAKTIIGCYGATEKIEGGDVTQVQIVKAIHAAIITPSCALRGSDLVSGIDIMIKIYLHGSTRMIVGTAHGMIIHVVEMVFGRIKAISNAGSTNTNTNASSSTGGDTSEAGSQNPSPKVPTANNTNDSATSTATDAGTEGGDAENEKAVVANGRSVKSSNGSEKKNKDWNDGILLFDRLSKLCGKSEEKAKNEKIDETTKILALELIDMILEANWSVLEANEDFVQEQLKKNLCLQALIANGLHQNIDIFRVTVAIVEKLVKHFRHVLKEEILAFVNLFLQVLGSGVITTQRKLLVLSFFHNITENPQILCDFFVNYDCDLQSPDIFGYTVEKVSHLVASLTGRTDHNTKQQTKQQIDELNQQNNHIQKLALETLSRTLKSMVDWSKELYESPIQKKIVAPTTTTTNNNNGTNNNTNTNASSSTGTPLSRAQSGRDTPQHVLSDDEEELEFDTASSQNAKEKDKWQLQKERKVILNKGKKMFELKPKKGIEYLQKMGIVGQGVEAIAQFLRHEPGIPKEALGAHLGDYRNQELLHAYVETGFDFGVLEIDLAMREFLNYFRLPKESEAIDRILEKFSEVYFRSYKGGQFEYADAVFILAFAIMMLATDRHSPMIKEENKITLAGWKRQLRGMNKEKDFNPDFLEAIFNRICALPFALTGQVTPIGPSKATPTSSFLDEKERLSAFLDESEQIAAKTQDVIRSALANKSEFFSAKNIEYVKPMFEGTWMSLLAAFTMSLEQTQDPNIIKLCMSALQDAIRVSGIFYLTTAQSAFITALMKFAQIGSKEVLQDKNIDAIIVLLEIGQSEGNYLCDNWPLVLRLVSQIDRLHDFATGRNAHELDPDEDDLPSGSAGKDGQSSSASIAIPGQANAGPKGNRSVANSPSRQSQPQQLDTTGGAGPGDEFKPHNEVINEVFTKNANIIRSQINYSMVEMVFSTNVKLTSRGILDLVKGLCVVSTEEIKLLKPRVFCMQKLVEIGVENMNARIRVVWNKLWKMLAAHFAFAGCFKNRSVAMMAIDKLKQLSMKFLSQNELANYNFQSEFLRPFEEVAKTKNRKVRQYTVDCLCAMIEQMPHNIRSGWKCIFQVFATQAQLLTSSNSDFIKITQQSFDTLKTIIDQPVYFNCVVTSYFQDLVNCISAFAITRKEKVHALNEAAVEMLTLCAQKLVTLQSQGINSASTDDENADYGNQFVILVSAFVHIHSDTAIAMRPKVLSTLFEILQKYGKLLSLTLWKRVMQDGLWHMFDKVKGFSIDGTERTEKLTQSQQVALAETSDTFKSFHEITVLFDELWSHLSPLLSELLDLMVAFMESENEHLAIFGSTAFDTLLSNSGSKFTNDHWSAVCAAINRVLTNTEPAKLRANVLPTETEQAGPKTEPVSTASTNAATPSNASNQANRVIVVMKGQAAVRTQVFKVVKDTILQLYSRVLLLDHWSQLLESAQACFRRSSLFHLDHDFHDRMEDAIKSNASHQGLFDFQNLVAVDALYTYLDVLFMLQADTEHAEWNEFAEKCLIGTCTTIIQTYNNQSILLMSDRPKQPMTSLRPRQSTRSLASPAPNRSNTTHALSSSNAGGNSHANNNNGAASMSASQASSSGVPDTPRQLRRVRQITEITVPVLLLILEKIMEFSDEKFVLCLSSLYTPLFDLTMSDSYDVRLFVRQTLWRAASLLTKDFAIEPYAPFQDRLVQTSAPVESDIAEAKQVAESAPVLKETEPSTDATAKEPTQQRRENNDQQEQSGAIEQVESSTESQPVAEQPQATSESHQAVPEQQPIEQSSEQTTTQETEGGEVLSQAEATAVSQTNGESEKVPEDAVKEEETQSEQQATNESVEAVQSVEATQVVESQVVSQSVQGGEEATQSVVTNGVENAGQQQETESQQQAEEVAENQATEQKVEEANQTDEPREEVNEQAAKECHADANSDPSSLTSNGAKKPSDPNLSHGNNSQQNQGKKNNNASKSKRGKGKGGKK